MWSPPEPAVRIGALAENILKRITENKRRLMGLLTHTQCLPYKKLIAFVRAVVKVPIMSKKFFRSSNFTFHLKNFCEKIFQFG